MESFANKNLRKIFFSNTENGAAKILLNARKLHQNIVDATRLKLGSIIEKNLTYRANS